MQPIPGLLRGREVVGPFQMNHDQVEHGRLVFRVNLESLSILAQSILGPAQIEVRGSQVRVGIDILRVQFQGLLVPLNGLRVLMLIVEIVGQLQPRLRIFGVLGGLLLERLDDRGSIDGRMPFRQLRWDRPRDQVSHSSAAGDLFSRPSAGGGPLLGPPVLLGVVNVARQKAEDEEYYRECQALVKRLDLSEKIKFIGHSDNMLDLYRKADIFVLSSRSEGVPLALLEAMSCGLPSVCTAVGGVPEILPDTITGFLVPPGDIDCLASKISTLLDDPELRKKMGIRARELIKEKYTVGEMAQKILGIYNEMFAKETKVNGSS
jgi:glycosyltransferase involved in cell wall biosynthesis